MADYLDYCDQFYFAVPEDFPLDLLPDDCGLMRVDAYGGAVLRPAPLDPVKPARRKAVTARYARAAACGFGGWKTLRPALAELRYDAVFSRACHRYSARQR